MALKLFFVLLIGVVLPNGKLFAQDLVETKLTDSIPVSFESGSAAIRNTSALLSKLNEITIRHGKIRLIAYTDTVGSNLSNRNLASQRLLSVAKLIETTQVKSFILDSINRNEERKGTPLLDAAYRRVDILVYSVIPKIKLDAPINLLINFHPQSTNLTGNSMNTLKTLQLLMEMDTTLHIQLNGHVCCRPDLILSLHRAEKVKSYLVSHGIESKRIVCQGFSNDVKLVPETSEENKKKNMRVEVVFRKK